MNLHVLGTAIQFALIAFFGCALGGMVYMCWKRARIERSREANPPAAIATEQEQRRTQAVRLLGAPRELPVVQVKAWKPRPRGNALVAVADQEVFIEWASQDQQKEG